MLKNLFLPLILLASAATAQTGCPKPVVKVLRNGEEVPATGSALAPSVTLQVTPAAECPEPVSYRFSSAELTLVRRGRPVLPAMRVRQPQADLRAFMGAYQPGDHIFVFVPYQSLFVVAADGSQQPYPRPKRTSPKPGQFDISTDEAKGIGFNWLLGPK